MIAPLLGAAALAAAIQFAYYCRSALVAARKTEPSLQVLRSAGLNKRSPDYADFPRFLELVSLCPEHGKDAMRIRQIAIYYRLLGVLETLCRELVPAVSSWAKREQASCAHFAAVALERRISSSRELFLQHGTNRL